MKFNNELKLRFIKILLLIFLVSSIFFFAKPYIFKDNNVVKSAINESESKVLEEIEEEETLTEISVLALGDNLLHVPIINGAKTEDERGYDFKPIFEYIESDIKEADISFINQETVPGGDEYGMSGYPLFNSPSEVQRDLSDLGFDVVNHATNHTLDKTGAIEITIDNWNNYENVNIIGVSESQSDRDDIEIMNVKGLKIAFLGYTYGTNGIPVPEDKPYIVNLIDKDQIKKDIDKVKDFTDVIIVSLHWGIEYMHEQSDEQEDIAQFIADTGEVEVIIGHHPHVIQPVEIVKGVNGNEMIVAYSLGNMVSSQDTLDNLFGGMLKFNIIKEKEEITIEDVKVVPIVTYYNINYRDFKVIPLADYTSEIAQTHCRDFMRYESSINNIVDISNSVLDEYCSIE
jgi:poly-gamma-glutamate synthesis protein (capsule biosynthesis protein)